MLKKLFIPFVSIVLFTAPVFGQGLQTGAVELGAYGGYGFPDNYGGLNPKDRPLFGARIGAFLTPNVSFEPSFQIFWSKTAAGTGFKIYSTRFNLLYNFLSQKRINPFVTGGIGWERSSVSGFGKSDDLGFNAGGGARFFFTDSFAARLDGRFVYNEVGGAINRRQYNYEAMLGLAYIFGGKPAADTDGDGVNDRKDKCADTPKGATVDKKGCPTDSDSDGVFDGIDQCAGTAKDTKVDEKGCPMDSDGDGVHDGIDQCPNTFKGAVVDEKGCPTDTDADGVADKMDKCPNTPKEAKVDEAGCPIDTDLDGIPDFLDKCPGTKKGSRVDVMGCPLQTKARGVLKGVNFKFGKAEIHPDSYKVLDATAVALQEFPEVQVEVQGHTDSTGPEAANKAISQSRAQSVSDYLVSKGVSSNRLHPKGYGEEKSIASNKTRAGRAKNRRVELLWLDAAPKN